MGSDNLNLLLQKSLNKSEISIESMGNRFKIGDKVMQIKNNYNKGIFNGDMGKISRIGGDIEVSFGNKRVEYQRREMAEIALAYATSVHKYQGCESKCIIIPLHISQYKMLHRNLFYTAITRGKKMVILISTRSTIAIATTNNNENKRKSGLAHFLGSI